MADALYNKGTTKSVRTVRFEIITPFSGQVRKVIFRTHWGQLCVVYTTLRLENGVVIWGTGLHATTFSYITTIITLHGFYLSC